MTFTPDWCLTTGEIILDIAEEKGLSKEALFIKLGYSQEFGQSIIDGSEPITKAIAANLADVLGRSATFWVVLDSNYKRHCERLLKNKGVKNGRNNIN